MKPQESKQKINQYENSIYQFLSSSNTLANNNNNNNVKNNISQQTKQKQVKIDRVQVINRKQTITKLSNKPNHNKITPILNQMSRQSPYTSLLSSITKQINLMNNHISSEIHENQNGLLANYELKMKAKITQLNKLKQTTNQEMIKEKTILRKQQLQRQKKSLIQGNFYYDSKLKEIKKELQSLMNKRANLKKTIEVLSKQKIQNKTNLESNSYAISLKQHKKNQQFNSQQNQINFVSNVLRKYNQKSDIFQQSLTQSIAIDNNFKAIDNNLKANRNNSFSSNLKNSLHFPKINQKKFYMHESLNPQKQILIDEYPLRKNQIKTNRALSIGGLSKSNINKKNKLVQNLINNTVSFGSIENHIGLQNEDKNNKIEKHSQTVNIKIHPYSYNKQDLEQFIVRKIETNKSTSQQKLKQKKRKELQIYEKKLIEYEKQLKTPSKIELLFKNCVKVYYQQKKLLGLKKIKKFIEKYKQNDLEVLHEVDESSIQNSRIASEDNLNVVKNEIDEKKAMKLLEQNQFDKKGLMDMLFQDKQFKRLIYDLILSQFQKTSLSQGSNYLKRPVNEFYGLSK